MAVGFVILLAVVKNPNFKTWLNSLMKMGPPATTPPPSGGGQQPPPSGGGGGGSTATGTSIYQVVGEIAATGDTRISGESSSHRDNQGFDCSKCSREATWIFTPGSGGDWSIKMGSHGGGSDNGSLIELGNVDTDGGGGEWRCEGPHNSYGDVSGGSGSAPALGGKAKVGLKGITWSTGAETVHHEVWYDESGSGSNWAKVSTFDGSAGSCNAITCPVPSGTDDAHCQDTLRIDNNSGHEFISRSIVEIVPGQASSGGGGGTPPPATTPPAEEDDEEEDGNGDGNGGITPAPASTPTPTPTCPSRCEPLRNSPASYQACCGSNAAGARSRRRNARIAMRNAMFAAFEINSPYSLIYNRRRRIVGNL